MNLYPMKLSPKAMSYIWGGSKLVNEWNKVSKFSSIAESLELSALNDCESIIANGEYSGKKITDIFSPEILGENCNCFEYFPILIKLIDARENLSIQVHPNDDYALKNEGQYGKTEVWYVVDAEIGAGLYCGFKNNIDKKKLNEILSNGNITDELNFIEVKKGDVLFVEAGTVHAICGGILVYEAQQNSSLTYRLFDYNRTDASGKSRELHIEKAIDVVNLNGVVRVNETVEMLSFGVKRLAKCKYFSVEELFAPKFKLLADKSSFIALTFLENGQIIAKNIVYLANKGDTYFIPANLGSFDVLSDGVVIKTTV